MKFKDQRCEDEYDQANFLLKRMADDFQFICYSQFKIDPTITRVREAIDGSSGVHEAGRGIDFRDEHDGIFVFNSVQRTQIGNVINALYKRNDGKKTLIWHRFKNGPYHWHLQISDKTETYNVI